jgi:hypothetical protein
MAIENLLRNILVLDGLLVSATVTTQQKRLPLVDTDTRERCV